MPTPTRLASVGDRIHMTQLDTETGEVSVARCGTIWRTHGSSRDLLTGQFPADLPHCRECAEIMLPHLELQLEEAKRHVADCERTAVAMRQLLGGDRSG